MTEIAGARRKKLIIATVGLCGVGKSAASHFLAERLETERVYFGGLVTAEIRRRGVDATPETEKTVREELRERYGMDAVAKLAVDPIDKVLEHQPSVVIDGLYSFAEYTFLRDTFGPSLVSIALHVAKELRYARLAARQKRPLSQDQVDQRDWDEVRYLDKAPPIALADYHVVNDSSVDALHEALDTVLRSLGRTPR